MTMVLTELLDRLSRLHLNERREDDLNPAQRAALDYLARANRFSRMPSAVADYLAATRGTVSQTLKALARKGLIRDYPHESDKRTRRLDLTDKGRLILSQLSALPDFDLSQSQLAEAETTLRQLLTAMLNARGRRSFGLCKTCRHHGKKSGAPFCTLLDLALTADETTQICVEHEVAA